MTEWGRVPHKEEGGEDRCGVHIPSVDIATQGVTQFRGIFHNFTDKDTSRSDCTQSPCPCPVSTVELLDSLF